MDIKEFKVERWLNSYETLAEYELAETDVSAFTLKEFLSIGKYEELKQKLLDIKLGYNLPTSGSIPLRERIASLYGSGTTSKNVLVTTGAIEADLLATHAILSSGDTMIVQFPAYQVLYSPVEATGVNVKFWKMRFEDGFKPDIGELKKLIDDKTRLVVLNIPNNPTGALINEADLRKILEWADEFDFYVLCDEVYHDIDYNGVVPPYGRSLNERAISIGSLSKAYGLSGLRLGWIVGPEWLIERCWSLKDYTSISNSPISDFLANVVFENRGKVMDRNLGIVKTNLQIMLDFLKEHEDVFEYVIPEAGVLFFPKLRGISMTSEEFCKLAIDEKKLLMVPGECFGYEGHLRIGVGGNTDRFKKALGVLSEFIRSHFKR